MQVGRVLTPTVPVEALQISTWAGDLMLSGLKHIVNAPSLDFSAIHGYTTVKKVERCHCAQGVNNAQTGGGLQYELRV